ncbi:MAG: sigma-70 family RNA polymerase sigma factor [Thermoanaerobaculia bacterium]
MSHDRDEQEPAGVASQRSEVTLLLDEWSRGDAGAFDRLMPLVYRELKAIAARQMRREPAGLTLQATAVVHEAYLRLVDQSRVQWKNRGHFFAVAAQAMRRILVDHARARQAAKRGGGHAAPSLEDPPAVESGVSPLELLALDLALDRLAAADPDQARIVELRFFAGLTLEETAEVEERSLAAVNRDWRTARAFLHRELGMAAPAP